MRCTLKIRRVLHCMFANHLNHACCALTGRTISSEVAVNVGRNVAGKSLTRQVKGHVFGPEQVACNLLEISEPSWCRLCHRPGQALRWFSQVCSILRKLRQSHDTTPVPRSICLPQRYLSFPQCKFSFVKLESCCR